MENNNMDNELNNEMEIIELEAEDGTVVEAQLVDTFFYNGEEYAVLSELVDGKPDADEDDNLVIFFMHIIPGAEDSDMDEYESIEDEKLDEELFNVYNANFSEDEQA